MLPPLFTGSELSSGIREKILMQSKDTCHPSTVGSAVSLYVSVCRRIRNKQSIIFQTKYNFLKKINFQNSYTTLNLILFCSLMYSPVNLSKAVWGPLFATLPLSYLIYMSPGVACIKTANLRNQIICVWTHACAHAHTTNMILGTQ